MKAHIQQLPGIAAFSDELRDGLCGPFNDNKQGAFIAGIPGQEESIKFGIVGALQHPQVTNAKVNYSQAPWTNAPSQMIAYVSCHDDMCLVDRLKASVPGIEEDELIRLNLLAQTAVFTSQGIPFILSGEEMLRNKQGVHNSYQSPIEINRLDWDNLKKYPQVFNYYKGLIALRKQYAAFRMQTAEEVRENLRFTTTKPCFIAYELYDKATDSFITVALNSNKTAMTLPVQRDVYKLLVKDGRINLQGLETNILSSIEVPAQSAIVAVRKASK